MDRWRGEALAPIWRRGWAKRATCPTLAPKLPQAANHISDIMGRVSVRRTECHLGHSPRPAALSHTAPLGPGGLPSRKLTGVDERALEAIALSAS
jgi:hypothetical protein